GRRSADPQRPQAPARSQHRMSSCPRLERLPATEPAPGLRLASATSRRARTLGLMGVADLPEGWALHIDRTSSVHTFWMRFALAPLAGIGTWFVRLQARRHGAGLVMSEMVSSFGIHHRNAKTCAEMLRVHPDEHPMAIQLFGQDAEVMRSAAATVAEAGADL